MSKATRGMLAAVILALLAGVWWYAQSGMSSKAWTDLEITLIRSLWIDNLPPLPRAKGNSVADDLLAAEFGHRLFFDKRLSANGQVSCASCHRPEHSFTDGLEVAEGLNTGKRNTMSIVGTAYSPWLFWDGRKDSLWSQALSPLENPLEHGSSRMQLVHLVAQDEHYRAQYGKLFGPLGDFSDASRFPTAAGPVDDKNLDESWQSMAPEDQEAVTRVFVNIGKAIAAYERLLIPGAARFDHYVEELVTGNREPSEILSKDERAGLRLFIGKAQCINCHNGPLLTNHEFHNTAVLSSPGSLPSKGRIKAVQAVLDDPFNCRGDFSDINPRECTELRFIRTGDNLVGAHKTPSLRNTAKTAPYMHAGQLTTLEEVIDHYDRAPAAMVGHNEAKVLSLRRREVKQIEAFLHTLTAPVAADSKWLKAPDQAAD
ncbi:MAG: cytochrome-c peroxidase [Gammaproteobacteria bacterium]|nr:cytochrome-c peroxidase [Gammaproteobacteria bacterium]